MRIVAGKYRRRKLLSNPGLVTRPITDRVKETLFERLEEDIVDKRIADVFAGTGTIGLEALSRGAAGVVFFEKDWRAISLLRKNVEMLEVEDQTLCWHVDVFRSSFRPKNVPHLLPFDTVFFDPPYRMIETLTPGRPFFKSLERLARNEVTHPSARLALRTPRNASFEFPSCWEACETLCLSSMEIHMFVKRDNEEVTS